MRPRTGRRHQLRIHSLVLGHPIVGDVTYQYQHHYAVGAIAPAAVPGVYGQSACGGGFGTAERMMLHAHSLK